LDQQGKQEDFEMKRVLLAAAAAIMMVAATIPAKADWIAVAVNGAGYGYGESSYSMEDARVNARENCYERTGYECIRGGSRWSVSVHDSTWLVVARCGRAWVPAASDYSVERALGVAAGKVGSSRGCSLINSW
jgi:hypothetical protein